jgi:glycolate oxidase FAD binding subunit
MKIQKKDDPLVDDPFAVEIRSLLKSQLETPVLPVGSCTKSGLLPGEGVCRVPVRDHQGIVAYDASEFLITARAGTRIRQLQEVLSEKRQYLPFDPLFASSEATLGGTIASGVSGPDRLLFGGIRDFIMEVAMLDGLGNLVRGGGKVVKNAAGFDTPKMMVGSCGRMGILLEATLKVFPVPQSGATLVFDNDSLESALASMRRILSRPFPISGLDITPDCQVQIRLAAPASSLTGAARRIEDLLSSPAKVLAAERHLDQMIRLKEWFETAPGPAELFVKTAVFPTDLLTLDNQLNKHGFSNYRYCAAGTVTWIKLAQESLPILDAILKELSLSGQVVRGSTDKSFIGQLGWMDMAVRIQRAIDPEGRFLSWDTQ